VVVFTAMRALCNAIRFIGSTLKNPAARDYVMQSVITHMGCNTNEWGRVRAEALETAVRIAREHYDHIGNFVQAFYKATLTAMRDQDESIAGRVHRPPGPRVLDRGRRH
jgi:hypothetical protein